MAFGSKRKRLQSNNFHSKKKARDEGTAPEKEITDTVLSIAHMKCALDSSRDISAISESYINNTVPIQQPGPPAEWEFASRFFVNREPCPTSLESYRMDVNLPYGDVSDITVRAESEPKESFKEPLPRQNTRNTDIQRGGN
ncbi:hypothetical protein BDQ17DRAFT_1339792 [Cyathus striatus]|nr:hypothetical protein BDQ17DRAFT_1339792 [Cyathus striatus]